MTALVGYLLLFVAVGFGFIFVHLLAGKLIRPDKTHPEKMTVYECGEPTIGSAWVQFDLRFYVVALLFVIFDVEVAFFFPWAVVFGQANTLVTTADQAQPDASVMTARREMLGADLARPLTAEETDAARDFALIVFGDILVFFGVLLVGFVYLWKRGDLDWVRAVAMERAMASRAPPRPAEALVGAGSH